MQAENMASIIENFNNCLQDFRTEISLIPVMGLGEIRRYYDDIQRQLDECVAIRQQIVSMNESYRKLTVIVGQTRVKLNEIQNRLDESLKEQSLLPMRPRSPIPSPNAPPPRASRRAPAPLAQTQAQVSRVTTRATIRRLQQEQQASSRQLGPRKRSQVDE
ncbi:Protein of unknown function [Pyronema omphalodes CBS 100304]|uniref:Uncharacterized protein n=1 Tax=Pyronema omphalodes (strain CBS 100304) TaxID=1076935 RepID=U4LNX0_PYROM|nr:Protein of unknown function [Pyronema omphalodes CBS 100304]